MQNRWGRWILALSLMGLGACSSAVGGGDDDDDTSSGPIPYNDQPDYEGGLVDRVFWDRLGLTYGFANYTDDLSQSEQREEVELALALWSAACPALTFTEDSSDPDILISWRTEAHGVHPGNFENYGDFDGPGDLLGHAWFPWTASSQAGDAGDIHLDDDEEWAREHDGSFWGDDVLDLSIVVGHELGHSLGLVHDEVEESDLMAESYDGDRAEGLGPGDIQAIQDAYDCDGEPGQPPCEPAGVLSCSDAGPVAGSNTAVGSTHRIDEYGCSSVTSSGPEYAYSFTSLVTESVRISVTDMTEDLDLFVLEAAPSGVCDPADCIDHDTGTTDGDVEFTAQAGTEYFVVVDGYAGAESNYTIELECGDPLPDLEVTAVACPPAVTAGESFTCSVEVRNNGAAAAGSNVIGLALSSDTLPSGGDDPAGSCGLVALSAGQSTQVDCSATVPSALPEGVWYILALADSADQVTESDEGNNIGHDAVSVSQPESPADIVVSSVSCPSSVVAGDTLDCTVQLSNTGGTATGAFDNELRLSDNTSITSQDSWLGDCSCGGISPGGSTSITCSGTVSVSTNVGSWYAGVIADSGSDVDESSGSNNTGYDTVEVTAPPTLPDLVVAGMSCPAASGEEDIETCDVTISNIGSTASGSFDFELRLSTNTTITSSDDLLATCSSATVAGGGSLTTACSGEVPAGTPAGDWYYGVIVDSGEVVTEEYDNNNTGAEWTWVVNPSISNTPSVGTAGTTFTQSGEGFFPNATATLYFFEPPPALTPYPPFQVNTDANGEFVNYYTATTSNPLGTYQWYAEDNTNQEWSEIETYLLN